MDQYLRSVVSTNSSSSGTSHLKLYTSRRSMTVHSTYRFTLYSSYSVVNHLTPVVVSCGCLSLMKEYVDGLVCSDTFFLPFAYTVKVEVAEVVQEFLLVLLYWEE